MFVLWLVVTEPWATDESNLTASATKTAEEAEPNLTESMLIGIMDRHYEDSKEAGYPSVGPLSGGGCLIDSGFGMHLGRFTDLKKAFDPKMKEWEFQATGRLCDGIEYFYINDVTGKLSR